LPIYAFSQTSEVSLPCLHHLFFIFSQGRHGSFNPQFSGSTHYIGGPFISLAIFLESWNYCDLKNSVCSVKLRNCFGLLDFQILKWKVIIGPPGEFNCICRCSARLLAPRETHLIPTQFTTTARLIVISPIHKAVYHFSALPSTIHDNLQFLSNFPNIKGLVVAFDNSLILPFIQFLLLQYHIFSSCHSLILASTSHPFFHPSIYTFSCQSIFLTLPTKPT
jgi:hypothetical protein